MEIRCVSLKLRQGPGAEIDLGIFHSAREQLKLCFGPGR